MMTATDTEPPRPSTTRKAIILRVIPSFIMTYILRCLLLTWWHLRHLRFIIIITDPDFTSDLTTDHRDTALITVLRDIRDTVLITAHRDVRGMVLTTDLREIPEITVSFIREDREPGITDLSAVLTPAVTAERHFQEVRASDLMPEETV